MVNLSGSLQTRFQPAAWPAKMGIFEYELLELSGALLQSPWMGQLHPCPTGTTGPDAPYGILAISQSANWMIY